MKKTLIGYLSFVIITTSLLLVTMFGFDPSGNAAQQDRILPIPTVTVTLPQVVKTVIKTIHVKVPGPTKTIKIPGPTKTVSLPGPTHTVFISPKATPGPTVTKTVKITAPPKIITSIKPEIRKSIETGAVHDTKVREKVREFTIGILGIGIGMVVLGIVIAFMYYLGRKQGDISEAGFLQELKERLHRKG